MNKECLIEQMKKVKPCGHGQTNTVRTRYPPCLEHSFRQNLEANFHSAKKQVI